MGKVRAFSFFSPEFLEEKTSVQSSTFIIIIPARVFPHGDQSFSLSLSTQSTITVERDVLNAWMGISNIIDVSSI